MVSPCEGTGYEIGSMSIVKSARDPDEAKQFYDWALTPEAQEPGAKNNRFPDAVEHHHLDPTRGARPL